MRWRESDNRGDIETGDNTSEDGPKPLIHHGELKAQGAFVRTYRIFRLVSFPYQLFVSFGTGQHAKMLPRRRLLLTKPLHSGDIVGVFAGIGRTKLSRYSGRVRTDRSLECNRTCCCSLKRKAESATQ